MATNQQFALDDVCYTIVPYGCNSRRIEFYRVIGFTRSRAPKLQSLLLYIVATHNEPGLSEQTVVPDMRSAYNGPIHAPTVPRRNNKLGVFTIQKNVLCKYYEGLVLTQRNLPLM